MSIIPRESIRKSAGFIATFALAVAFAGCGSQDAVRFGPPLSPRPAARPAVSDLVATGASVAGTVPPSATTSAVDLVSTSVATPSATQLEIAIASQAQTASTERIPIAVSSSVVDGPVRAGRELRDGNFAPMRARRLPGVLTRSSNSARRSFAVGDRKDFYIAIASRGGDTTSYATVPFTLGVTTANTSVWFATASAQAYTPHAAQIGTDIETALASDVRWLGLPTQYSNAALALTYTYQTCDSAGNPAGTGPFFIPPYPTIDVLIVPPTTLGPGIGGQFVSADLSPQNIANCNHAKSNEAATITVGLDPATPNIDYFMKSFIAHEGTHLIAYINNAVTFGHGGAIPGVIDEGLASLAEDLVGTAPDYNTIFEHVTPFLKAPQNYAILSMNAIEDGHYGRYTLGNYGAAYLFMRYIADRDGLGFAKSYIVSDAGTTPAASFATLASSAGATSFAKLYDDFGTTLAASSRGIPIGVPYVISSFALGGTYSGPSTTLANETFALPGVVAAGTLPATRDVPLFPGGIAILDASTNIAGRAFGATDPSGALQLNGSIVSY